MVKRKIISIDEEKCDGCGECIPACDEGAIEIIDGVARLKEERLCDGLGDCLGECPQDAIKMEVREAEEFDEEAVKQAKKESKSAGSMAGSCPGSRMRNFQKKDSEKTKADERSSQKSNDTQKKGAAAADDVALSINSQLEQWPVQLGLLPEKAPFFDGADLLIAADCVPFAYADFHLDLLRDKKVVIGCPKLDNLDSYIEKLTGIIANNDINSLAVAIMEVPCCKGMLHAVNEALKATDKELNVEKIVISVEGEKKQ